MEGRRESEYLNLIYPFPCQTWSEGPRACLLELGARIMRLGGRKFGGRSVPFPGDGGIQEGVGTVGGLLQS